MRIFICGMDGYLGWSLACYLNERGHFVAGCDNYLRRSMVHEVGSDSAVPIPGIGLRERIVGRYWGQEGFMRRIDLLDYDHLRQALEDAQPDAVVHLAEQPSAPFSMMGPRQAADTQYNNVVGSLNLLWAMKAACPEAHLLKLGTMGEYGTPDCPIPEGFFTDEAAIDEDQGPKHTLEGLPFPRQPGSLYHASKVADSVNVDLACRMWGLRSTDIMQGVVYGTTLPQFAEDEQLWTRFDFDECFGTAINRFCAQAVVGLPITPYGKGEQKRGFLPLADSMQCLTLALENPPAAGEYRVFNQFEGTYTINHLANVVHAEAAKRDLAPTIHNVPNPRKEAEEHFYEPAHQHLLDLGYQPNHDLEGTVGQMLDALLPHRARIEKHQEAIQPKTLWN